MSSSEYESGSSSEEEEEYEPTLQNVLENDSLKFVFFGGKGGVGKSSNSGAFALQLAARRAKLARAAGAAAAGGEGAELGDEHRVLLISTDPAHNLSDVYDQKFTSAPTPVRGCPTGNLWAMEIDAEAKVNEGESELKEALAAQEAAQRAAGGGAAPPQNPLAGLLGDMDLGEMSSALPGIDEMMSFAEMMRMVNTMEFSAVVFDTAPTGHTLRLLAFPALMKKGLSKLLSMQDSMGGMLNSVMAMMGGGGAGGAPPTAQLFDKLKEQMAVIEEVNKQFADPELTTFVCVCIPEFLSVYETERLIQQLTEYKIDSCNIVVNQVLYPPKGSDCGLCNARSSMQQKYLDQIELLYDEFHIVKLPLLRREIRGIPALLHYGKWQVEGYDAEKEPEPRLPHPEDD